MSARLRDPLLQLRPMEPADLRQVLAIETQVYEFPWDLGYLPGLSAGRLLLLAGRTG